MTVTVPSQEKRADKLLVGSNLVSRKGLEASLKLRREDASCSSGPDIKNKNTRQGFFFFLNVLFFYL